MKINNLLPGVVTLLLVAILLGVGLTVLGNFATQVRTSTTASDETLVLYTHNFTTVANPTATASGSTGYNSSLATDTVTLVWDTNENFRATSVRLASDTAARLNGSSINVTYTYGATNNWQTAIDSSVTSIDDFVPWFAVIIVVLMAAIIIGLVLRSFSGGR